MPEAMMMKPQVDGRDRGNAEKRLGMKEAEGLFENLERLNGRGEAKFDADFDTRRNRGFQLPPTANQRFGEFLRKRNTGLADGKGQKQNAMGVMESLLPRVPALLVREYAHSRTVDTGDDATRTDFTETLLWQPVLVVPNNGKLSVEFTLSDAINPYQVLIAGHTLDGRIGAITGTLEVRKPF